MLEIVLTGRNDGYGGEDFVDRLIAAATFNHRQLDAAGVPHTFTFVEWNPLPARRLLAETLRARMPWLERAYIASADWHQCLSENPRLEFMEFFAKNVAIRRSTAAWVLTTNSDIFLSQEIVARFAENSLAPGVLYRARRIDIDRTIDWQAATWATFTDTRVQLRCHDLEPPYFSNAAGDFLLLDRATYHQLGGFNETVRFAKIYKDGQFCIQAHARGLPIVSLGPVYHIDHDGSFITATAKYGPKHEEAPFGPWWDANRPYRNRQDWGLTQATGVLDAERGVIWLRTPEECGPTVSVLLNGASDAGTLRGTIEVLAGVPQIEVLVIDQDPRDQPSAVDSRIRYITGPGGTPSIAGLNLGLAEARGRWHCLMPTPSATYARALVSTLPRMTADADVLVCSRPGERRPWTQDAVPLWVMPRKVYDALGELSTSSAAPLYAYWQRVQRAFPVQQTTPFVVDPPVRLNAWLDGGMPERAWVDLINGDDTEARSEPVDAALADDLRRRLRALTAAVQQRLRRLLPSTADEMAAWGWDILTPGIIDAAATVGVRTVAIYTDDPALAGEAYLGIPFFPTRSRAMGSPLLTVLTSNMAADYATLRHRVPEASAVVLFGPPIDDGSPVDAWRPTTPLAYVQSLRDANNLTGAVAAFEQLEWVDDTQLLVEAMNAAVRVGRSALVLRLCRRLLRRPDTDHPLLQYRIGSLLKKGGQGNRAAQWFARVLDREGVTDSYAGGSAFHLGELCLAEHDLPKAAAYFRTALARIPTHAKAAEHLAAIERGWSPTSAAASAPSTESAA